MLLRAVLILVMAVPWPCQQMFSWHMPEFTGPAESWGAPMTTLQLAVMQAEKQVHPTVVHIYLLPREF